MAKLAKNGGPLQMGAEEQITIRRMNEHLRHISARCLKKPIVLFFGRNNFTDNSKYLFLHCASNADFEVVWCSMNVDLVRRLSQRGLSAWDIKADLNRTVALFLSASVAVHCVNPIESLETEFFLNALSGAAQLQLWHGVGAKKLDLMLIDKLPMMSLPQVSSIRWACSADVVVSPSRRYDPLWQESFGVNRLIRAGLPRNEVLLREATAFEEIDTIDRRLIESHDGLRILWAPTFSQSKGKAAWQIPGNVEAILRGAAERKPKLFVRPHPFDLDRLENGRPPPPATLLSSKDDVYPVLRHFDLLITDRSSLVSDFLLLDRPVLFLDDQHKPEPESDIVYDTPTPGLVADYADAEAAVRQTLTDDAFRNAREANRQAIFESDALTACADITQAIRKLIRERQPTEPTFL